MLALAQKIPVGEIVTRELLQSASADRMARTEVEQALRLVRLSGVATSSRPDLTRRSVSPCRFMTPLGVSSRAWNSIFTHLIRWSRFWVISGPRRGGYPGLPGIVDARDRMVER